MQSLVIAVDFDGTIVDDAYPGIGKPKMFAFQTLKEMQKDSITKPSKSKRRNGSNKNIVSLDI